MPILKIIMLKQTAMTRNPLGYKVLLTYQQADKIENLVCSLNFPFPPFLSRGKEGGIKGDKGIRDRFDHMVRSARSVKSNIAEGYARVGLNEYIRFLGFSLGSLVELIEDLLWLEKQYPQENEKLNSLIKLCFGEKTLLKRQIEALERKFIQEGGYAENMTKKRKDFRGY